jgi:hypothetical protein
VAIHLPRQRDSFGVPARYTDLKSAGLLYTPPGEWRYDSYDIEGDVATLYARDVDPDDYQYNADHGDAVPLPPGASAISCHPGRFAIFDGILKYKMPYTGTWVDTGLGGGFTSVAGSVWSGSPDADINAVAAQNGILYEVYCTTPGYSFSKYPFSGPGTWLTVNAIVLRGDNFDGFTWVFGKSTQGNTLLASMSSSGRLSSGAILAPYTDVQVAGTLGEISGVGQLIFGLILERASGCLYRIPGSPGLLPPDMLPGLGIGWTSLSGYASALPVVSDAMYQYTRMYGIKNGSLYSLKNESYTSTTPSWTATLIDDSGDWYMVQFIEPDVAVALRRVNTAGGGGGSGTIDPLGDVIVSGTGSYLDGVYSYISGEGDGRLWRRDNGPSRYEIYKSGGYWYIHSSFNECRGAGTDPWTATWETSWGYYEGNQGPVPTVTGTEA